MKAMAVGSSNLLKSENQTPSLFVKIGQFLKFEKRKEIISRTGLKL